MTKLRHSGAASSVGRLDGARHSRTHNRPATCHLHPRAYRVRTDVAYGGHEVAVSLNLAPWWDEPDYKTCNTFHLRGLFILRKLREHDPTKFHDVMADLYRDDQPDPQDIGTFEWQTILAFMGASEEEIKDVQLRMGRVWR